MVRPSNYSLVMRKSLLALLVVMAAAPLRAQEAVHVMQPKQTLYAVSRMYGVPVKTLLRINNFANPNKIKVGTAIKLPAGTKTVATSSTTLATQSVPETNTTAQETAAVTPADSEEETTQVLAKKSPTTDWRYFGPLQVDWSNWRTMAGSLVAPTLNKQKQPLYVAVNCGARKLNITGSGGTWKTWESPAESFERDLVKAACADPKLGKG
jgi:murein DD-endopeptidase MepM/ murein hydrolase activator NlpD